jgi:tyrosinase
MHKSAVWFALCFCLILLTACPGPGKETDQPAGTDVTTDTPDETPEPKESWVRPNFGKLAAGGPEIAALKKGVEVMKSKPATDPTSWLYQANMHGTYDGPPLDLWNTCQHGSFFFLSWHRMYLYYFERILRASSGDTNFALPFWDYTDPAQRALPEPFRLPADATNPLFVAERAPGINAGALLPESATQFEVAMTFTNFASPGGSGLSFGGPTIPGPVHFGSPPGQLESQPHNIIHVLVGGNSGWMSDPNLAARDAIFWLHHANIDRLWTVWSSRGGGRVNPTTGNWPTQTFSFFDFDGTKVTLTGQQVVDTAAQLNYTYAEGTGDGPGLQSAGEDKPAAAYTDDRRDVVTDKKVSARLRGQRSTVAVSLPAAEPEAVGDEGRPWTLVIEGLKFGRPGIFYEVYANLPQGATPDPKGPNYVGNVAFFGQLENGEAAHQGEKGLHGDATLSYDITELLGRLRGQAGFTGNLTLHFEPRGLEAPPGQAQIESVPSNREVRFERVKIIRE